MGSITTGCYSAHGPREACQQLHHSLRHHCEWGIAVSFRAMPDFIRRLRLCLYTEGNAAMARGCPTKRSLSHWRWGYRLIDVVPIF